MIERMEHHPVVDSAARRVAISAASLWVAAIAAQGLLLALAAAWGGPSWPLGIYAALVVLVALVVFVRGGRREARGKTTTTQLAAIETAVVAALGELRRGDLVRAAGDRADLPSTAARALSSTTRTLGDLAGRIQEGGAEVAIVADDVGKTTSDLASGSAELAASVAEITAAMEELARTAGQIASNAAIQADLAEHAAASCAAGAGAVDQAAAGMAAVQERIASIAERADVLGSRSKEIYRVLDLITEIAQETHILSLNAAIEAAAAGGEGRRIAVVAEEVRRLAHRSQDSVDSVRGLLDEFASSLRATVVATEEGSKEVARVVERSRSAAAAISDLERTAGDTAATARDISRATREQNSASDEVVMTLREVSQVVQRTADGLRRLSDTTTRMNDAVLSFELLAQSFHRDSPRSLKALVERWAGEIAGRPEGEIARALDDFAATAPWVEMVYFADPFGRGLQVSTTGARSAPRRETDEITGSHGGPIDWSRRPWFRAAMRDGRANLSPPYVSAHSGELCFSVSIQVPHRSGASSGPRTAEGLLGVLAVDVNVNGWTRG